MKKLLFSLGTGILLSMMALSAHAQSYNVLYVTGGGFHDYESQEEFLRGALTDRMDINWETDFTAGED